MFPLILTLLNREGNGGGGGGGTIITLLRTVSIRVSIPSLRGLGFWLGVLGLAVEGFFFFWAT